MAPLQRCTLAPLYEVAPMSTFDYFLDRGMGDTRLTVSRKDACEILGCKRTKLDRLIKSKQIQSYLDGGSRRVVTASVYKYILRKINRERLDFLISTNGSNLLQ